MYYKSSQESPSDSESPQTPRSSVVPEGLPLTPSVALRTLVEQLQKFEEFTRNGFVRPGSPINVFVHFAYPLPPPTPGLRRDVGSAVYIAVADYASKLLARQGMLCDSAIDDSKHRVARHTQLSRELFAFEHALAFGLQQLYPEASLLLRENAARCALGVAAYWCDRDRLLFANNGLSHPVLGDRPTDPRGQVLYDHAIDSFDAPHNLLYAQSIEFIDLRSRVSEAIGNRLTEHAGESA